MLARPLVVTVYAFKCMILFDNKYFYNSTIYALFLQLYYLRSERDSLRSTFNDFYIAFPKESINTHLGFYNQTWQWLHDWLGNQHCKLPVASSCSI